MSKLRAILRFVEARPRLGYVAIFSLVAALYGLTQLHPSFKDPDSFFHARMALLTLQSGPVTDFPWLPLTTLADAFADHHFLYHVALIPFVLLFGSFVGLKVAAAIFGAAAVTAFYFAARSLRLKSGWAFGAALLLATSANFMFRMNLVKAASLSVILLMLGISAAARRNRLALLILGFVYVWTHGSWPLLIFVAAVFALTDRSSKKRLTIFLAPVVGSLAGLVINPFFPNNVKFYWYQTVHATLINYYGTVNVGGEWRSISPLEMFGQNGAIFVLLILCAAIWFTAWLWKGQVETVRGTKGHPPSPPASEGHGEGARRGTKGRQASSFQLPASSFLALGIISATFLLMAARNIRHIEYFLPCAILLGAVAGDCLSRRYDLRRLWSLAFGSTRRLGIGFAVFICLIFPFSVIRDSILTVRSFRDDGSNISWSRFERMTEWMNGHLPEGAIVFHGNWGDFPTLFNRAPQFRYIAGLDPTFFYLKDPVRYFDWRATSEGQVKDVSAAVEKFGAEYVLVAASESAFAAAVAADSDLRLVYEDDEAKIFIIFP